MEIRMTQLQSRAKMLELGTIWCSHPGQWWPGLSRAPAPTGMQSLAIYCPPSHPGISSCSRSLPTASAVHKLGVTKPLWWHSASKELCSTCCCCCASN